MVDPEFKKAVGSGDFKKAFEIHDLLSDQENMSRAKLIVVFILSLFVICAVSFFANVWYFKFMLRFIQGR